MATDPKNKMEDNDDDDIEQLQYKIILLGDGAVGMYFKAKI